MTMTYVQAIDVALETVADEDVIAKLTALKTSLEKKAGATSASNSKRKAETQARAEKLYNALAEMDKPVTFKELAELTSDADVKTWTPQRMTALVRTLGDRVTKETIKRVNYYAVASFSQGLR